MFWRRFGRATSGSGSGAPAKQPRGTSVEGTWLRDSVRPPERTPFTTGAIDEPKHDTTQETLQRRSLLPQHSCIILQIPSVRPRSRLSWGRLGLEPDITRRITVSSRYPSNGSNPENVWMKTRHITGGRWTQAYNDGRVPHTSASRGRKRPILLNEHGRLVRTLPEG